tara:strand:- start:1747 stop:1917 length:171 start_codon:yes stop_codon:yes gene_type:complete
MKKDERILANLCLAMVGITTVFTVLLAVEIQSTLLTFIGALMTVCFALPIVAIINK